jgi:predicted DNA-binding protein (MmcQ/YjbR family)
VTLESVRMICMALPDTTEDIKWGQDLVFSVGSKMFCVVNTEPPHQMSFKTTAEDFAALVERTGLRPAPYLARAMWVQEEALGETLDRREVARLIRQAYELVRAKLPKRAIAAGRRSRAVPARTRRRRR